MTHPLVDQLRFARAEFERGLSAVRDPEAQKRFGNMNCLSWIVGHLAWQEQRYWLWRAQGKLLLPDINRCFAYGAPASMPRVDEMWTALHQIQAAAGPWLDALTAETIQAPLADGLSSVGTFLQRTMYHYWYHLGEGMSIRQLLGETGLPDFVGNIDAIAPYRSESQTEPARITKAQFLNEVQQAHHKLAEWIALEGEAAKTTVALVTWYEREILNVLKTRIYTGSELWGLPEAQRNQTITEQNQARSFEEICAEAVEIQRQLEQEVERLEEEDLHQAASFAQMPADWFPWQVVAETSYQLIYYHLAAAKS